MLLQIRNPDKIIGHVFRWYHWKLRVVKWIETGDQYIFGCQLSNLRTLDVSDYTIRLCRKSLAMFSHDTINQFSGLTPPVDLKPEDIRDMDGFVRKMASRINLVI